MDINNNEMLGKFICNSLDDTRGIASKMYNNYQKKFLLPEQYLSEQIIKNKELTSDDLTVAAKLYGISKLRRHYKNISKIIYSADNIANLKGITSGEIDDDWMNYFLDRAENISDETVKNIYAYILANKFENKNGFRKVMLDRLALLDYDSAIAFLKLCQATYEIETSEYVYYSIPFYVRDSVLKKMVNCEDILFTESDAIKYQNIRPEESILEIIQDIGLIKLSEDVDECDIYSNNNISFKVSANNNSFHYQSKFDSVQDIYYAITGCCVFTTIGLELYNALKDKYVQDEQLFNLVNNYYKFQELI